LDAEIGLTRFQSIERLPDLTVVERPNSRFAKTPEILLEAMGAIDSVCPCNSLVLLGFFSSAGVAKRDDLA
jgi:hypothetical protein